MLFYVFYNMAFKMNNLLLLAAATVYNGGYNNLNSFDTVCCIVRLP
jgi:hypothetical protein